MSEHDLELGEAGVGGEVPHEQLLIVSWVAGDVGEGRGRRGGVGG